MLNVTSVSQVSGLNLATATKNDITNWINQGYTSLCQRSNTNVGTGNSQQQWQGVGYIVTDSNGLASYFIISGGVGGNVETQYGGGSSGVFQHSYRLYSWLGSGTVGDPIEISNGSVIHDETDMSIPNLGSPLEISRHYASDTTVGPGRPPGPTAAWAKAGRSPTATR